MKAITMLFDQKTSLLRAKAMLLGERLDVKNFSWGTRLSISPLTIQLPHGGVAVLFRYGAVVFISAPPEDEQILFNEIAPFLHGKFSHPESEILVIEIHQDSPERVVGNHISIPEASIGHLQAIANVMAKSVALQFHEGQVGKSFENIEPIATGLAKQNLPTQRVKELLKHIGTTLLSESNMIGRVEVVEKPDFLWDNATLDRFYMRLADDFELHDRQIALERKLELISRTAQTVLDILQAKHSLRVEWYIVALIVMEVILDIIGLMYH